MFQTISKECDLRDLKKAIEAAGLREAVATQDPITVFGPTDEAFERFTKQGKSCGNLTQTILYHALAQYLPSCSLRNDMLYPTLREGTTVRINVYKKPFNKITTINGVPIEEVDIKASNGILHKIGKVLCPPCGTIYMALRSKPYFSILVAAIEKAGLVSALNTRDSSLTLFAPTNEAFEDLLAETGLTSQQLLDNSSLSSILLYHVLGQTVFSVAIKEGYTCDIPTLLENKTIGFKNKDGKIKVIYRKKREAKVIRKNLLANGGVIHTINKVLLPFSL